MLIKRIDTKDNHTMIKRLRRVALSIIINSLCGLHIMRENMYEVETAFEELANCTSWKFCTEDKDFRRDMFTRCGHSVIIAIGIYWYQLRSIGKNSSCEFEQVLFVENHSHLIWSNIFTITIRTKFNFLLLTKLFGRCNYILSGVGLTD
jgi:hypothetical protein